MSFLSILLGILAIGLIALIHEVGHFVFARMVGIRVLELSLGAGPKILQFERGGTAYTFRLVPFLAYVKLEEKGEGSLEEAGIFQRFLLYIGGVFFNLVTAIIIIAFTGVFSGFITDKLLVGEVSPDMPAASVLVSGDQILEVDGFAVADRSELNARLEEAGASEVSLTVLRDGREVEAVVTPAFDEESGRYLLGFYYAKEKLGPLESVGMSFRMVGEYFVGTYRLIFDIARGTVDAGDSLVGVVGIVAISESFTSKVGDYLTFIAIISMGMGVLNLLPIPALDGGKIVLLGLEKIRGKKISEDLELKLTLIGFSLLILLMIFTTINDIGRLFGG